MDTTEIAAIIGAASALGGVGLKIAYDAVREHAKAKYAADDRFLNERKETYDTFWSAHKEVTQDAERLRELALIIRAGKDVKDGVLESFPPSSMPKLVDALDALRRIAHIEEIVSISERMMALHGDTGAALRHLIQNPHADYALPLFVANRMREDQELEFVAAYRKDLGVGPPRGSRSDWPMIKRPFALGDMETMFRRHVRHGPRVNPQHLTPVGPMDAKDAALLETPKIKAMLSDSSAGEDGMSWG
jgi:FAD/FMN-containing dehydrogenase